MRNLSEKTSFILAFAAILVGFSQLKTSLESIELNYVFISANAWTISLFSFVLLSISIYLYALDSIRYGFPSFEENRVLTKLFKFIQILANSFYLFAIILPLMCILFYGLVSGIQLLPVQYIRESSIFASIVTSISTFIVSFLISKAQLKLRVEKEFEIIQEKISDLNILRKELNSQKKWADLVLDNFKALELMFAGRTRVLGIDASKVPFNRLIRLLLSENIITELQVSKLERVREIRNIALHSNESIAKSQADFVNKVVIELQERLLPQTPTQTSARFFQKMVKAPLIVLFGDVEIVEQPILLKNKRTEYIARDESRTYYIEVTLADQKKYIDETLERVKKYLDKGDRGILVLPKSDINYISKYKNIKILYFDLQNHTFINGEEIKSWINGS